MQTCKTTSSTTRGSGGNSANGSDHAPSKEVRPGETGKEKLQKYYINIGLGFRMPLRALLLARNSPSLVMSLSEVDSVWCGDQSENAEDHCHLQKLPLLNPKVQLLQEMPQEHVCVPVLLLQGWKVW